ncbi:hypothetical protein [Taylorella asinigenitalis]|uniref:hypothetical protein n=1 Tax=Taylorella asinigenitalis TaxID=84590 RepID=UPI0004915C3F|nr:hypothetical protein [Taylorella asinigenitalis]
MGKILLLIVLNVLMFIFGMGYFGFSPKDISFQSNHTHVEFKPLQIEILKTQPVANENTNTTNS